MIVGKLYKCVAKVTSTKFYMKPGDIIMPTRVYEYEGQRRGRYRKGTCIQFIKGTRASQMKFCMNHWSQFFVMIGDK